MEYTARTFESVVKWLLSEQGQHNIFLVNIDPDSPEYLTDEEAQQVAPIYLRIVCEQLAAGNTYSAPHHTQS